MASFTATGIGLITLALLIPVTPQRELETRIFSHGLNVEIDRSSPAFAALEDSAMTFDAPMGEESKAVQTFELRSGVASQIVVAKIANEIVQSNEAERQAVQAVYAQVTAPVVQASQRVAQGLSDVAPTLEVTSPIEHPTKTISLSELKISREELLKELLLPIAQPGGVAKVDKPRQVAKNGFVPKTNQGSSSQTTDTSARTYNSDRAERGLIDAAARQNQSGDLDPASVQQLTISGHLEFAGGIALTSSNDRVVVFREVEGEEVEGGAVWLRDARYEIFVNEPIGELVAELRTSSGEVLGRGTLGFDRLPRIQKQQYRVDNVALKIKPLQTGIVARVIQPSGQTQKVSGARVQLEQLPFSGLTTQDGLYKEKNLALGSSVVVRAERAGHWGTLAFAQAGRENDIPLFANKAVEALQRAVAPQASQHASSVIWGRVTRGGQPVAGARVELMTTEDEVRPVYFNAMNLPDLTLQSTSANGLYAFFPIEPGSHAIQAVDAKGMTEPAVFPTDAMTVTSVDLELSVVNKARVRVFDAFRTDWPLEAQVGSVGRDHGVMVDRSGETQVRFTGGNAPLILDADSGRSYERVRVSVDRDQKSIAIPMVQSVWLDRIRGAMRLNVEAGSGTIVGFMQGQTRYSVALDENSVLPSSRVVYFDARGEVIQAPDGDPGGGFIIFNVPQGHRTLLVRYAKSFKVFSTTMLVESGYTNIVTKRLK